MSQLPDEPRQQAPLPQAPQGWLPEGHLAHFISDTVDSLDLQAFYAGYAGGGSRNQPFHPAMMVKVLVEIAPRQDLLNAIAQARARLEQRQREAKLDKGRDPEDKPRGGRYKREFGVPEDKAQDNFTDPDSRIMTRTGGGFDKWIAEPPNGWIKNVLGFRQFSLHGLHRVSAEWKLVCMALNLRRMATLSAS